MNTPLLKAACRQLYIEHEEHLSPPHMGCDCLLFNALSLGPWRGEGVLCWLLPQSVTLFFQGLGNFSIHSIEVDTGGFSVEVVGCDIKDSAHPGGDRAV